MHRAHRGDGDHRERQPECTHTCHLTSSTLSNRMTTPVVCGGRLPASTDSFSETTGSKIGPKVGKTWLRRFGHAIQ
jgi:hypothetical protein